MGAQGVLSIVQRLQVYRPKKVLTLQKVYRPKKAARTKSLRHLALTPPATNVFPNFLPNSCATHLGHERV